MESTIYQQLWDADQAANGVLPLRPDEERSADRGFVVVDEREADVGEDHRVLAEVAIPDAKRETYDLCARLFNNYTLDPGVREQLPPEETQEEKDFIDAILPSPPIQLARDFIGQRLGQSISDLNLAAMIKETWFFQGLAGTKTASGFEHVFVGEQHPKGEQPDDQKVGMTGYHFWYKYHLDEIGSLLPQLIAGQDRIVYHGTRYGGAEVPGQGILVPEIVTLSFCWHAHDFTTGRDQLLQKHVGGFFVGLSPEGLIAQGLVRTRTDAGQFATINGSTYRLDFHALSNNRLSIRTFFPRFIRSDFVVIDRDEQEHETRPESAGLVRIIAALVNPEGHDPGRETVTLINTSPEPADLAGWAIVAPNGTRFVFADVTLAAGEVRTFRMPTSGAQLRNRGGDVTLLDASGGAHDQVSYSTEEARRQGFTVVF